MTTLRFDDVNIDKDMIVQAFKDGFEEVWGGDMPPIGIHVEFPEGFKRDGRRYLQYGGFVLIRNTEVITNPDVDALFSMRAYEMGGKAALLLSRSKKKGGRVLNYIHGLLVEGGIIRYRKPPKGSSVLNILIIIKSSENELSHPLLFPYYTVGWKATLEVA